MAYRNRGFAYADKDEYDLAIADYAKATELDPDYAAAYNSLAWLCADTLETNLEEVLELAQSAVELQPESPYYLDTLAWTYYKLGRYQEALDIYNKTIERTPDASYLYLGRGHVNAEVGEVTAAIADLEMYVQLEPDADDRAEIEALISELRGE